MKQSPENGHSENSANVEALSGRQIAHAAGLVVFGFILSRLLGLIREALIGGIFGAASDYEAYAVALQVPDTIYYVIAGGAIGSAFIPVFTEYLSKGKKGEAWKIANAVTNLFFVILALVAALCAVLARPIVTTLLAPGFAPEVQDLTIRLMQIMLISPVIFGISGLQMGMLNAHQRFLLPALAPSLYNVGIILGAVVLAPLFDVGVYGLAWGVVLGAALHMIVQWPGLKIIQMPYRLIFDIKHTGVREITRLMAPRVLGQAVVQVNFWVNKSLASNMIEGSVAAIQRAWYLLLLPQGVIAQSVATAVFPTFSAQVAQGKTEDLKETLGQVLRAVLFLSIPATVGLVVLRLPIVRLMYERGAFTPADSQAVAWALLFYGLGLVAHSLVEIITRTFYAMHDTRTPVGVGVAAMAINVVLSLVLIRVMGNPQTITHGAFAGLALANTLATTLEGVVLLVLIRPRVGGLGGRQTLSSLLKAGAASAGMGLALWAIIPLITRWGQYLGPLAAIVIGGLVFYGLAWLLRSEEVRIFTTLALNRLKRSRR
jgi:putative peptidoglycan lipid II flippase